MDNLYKKHKLGIELGRAINNDEGFPEFKKTVKNYHNSLHILNRKSYKNMVIKPYKANGQPPMPSSLAYLADTLHKLHCKANLTKLP